MNILVWSDRSFRTAMALVFWTAIVLRLVLSAVNYQANDDHMKVIQIILDENRLPVKTDAWEGFQPKLYHLTVATILKILPVETERLKIITAQLVSCFAGIMTLVFVRLFLTKQSLSNKAKLFCFALIALNPKLIGINAQATNDSFVILFATATLYYLYRFLANKESLCFLWLTFHAVLTGLSKGTGLFLFPTIIIVFVLKIATSKKSLDISRYLRLLIVFLFIYLATVSVLGQYYYNYRYYGTPFATNWESSHPIPNFFKSSYFEKPGATSIVNSYLTFRIIDLVKNPWITYEKAIKPLHRTSFWSQIYGRTHFVFFDMWPPTWQTSNPAILNIGRAILLLALIPTLILCLEFLRSLWRWGDAFIKKKLKSFIANTNDWIFDLALIGSVSVLLFYTMKHRDFITMKAIFIFPALLAVASLLARGLDRIERLPWRGTISIHLATVFLVFLYILCILGLIGKLGIALASEFFGK